MKPVLQHLLSALLVVASISGCANLQPEINNLSLESYQHGCTLRGVQRGLSPQDARKICQCHTQKAIEETSLEEFLIKTDRIAKASEQERQSDEIKADMKLMKDTFQRCKTQQLEN